MIKQSKKSIYIKNVDIYRKSRFISKKSIDFQYESTFLIVFLSKFISSQQFRLIPATILDRKCWLNDDLNPISNEIWLKVDLITLAYRRGMFFIATILNTFFARAMSSLMKWKLISFNNDLQERLNEKARQFCNLDFFLSLFIFYIFIFLVVY